MYFYIPLFYLFKTRLKAKFEKIAWFFTYLIPVFISFYAIGETSVGLIILFILTTFSVYEVGYIYNDLELTKREVNPTIRLTSSEMSVYEKQKIMIYSLRGVTILMLLGFSFLWYPKDVLFIFLNMLLIGLIYIVYNSIRNNWNIVLYMLLLLLKYFGFIVFKYPSLELIVMLLAVYPLANTFIFATKDRFWTSRFLQIKDSDKFRFFYYVTFLIIFLLIFDKSSEFYRLYISMIGYFTVYRVMIYGLLSRKLR